MTHGRKQRLEAFARLARIGAGRGNDVRALLNEACQLTVDTLGLQRSALYRLLPGGEIVPVVACGEPPLEHVGGSVTRLEERQLFKRAFDAKDIVVVRGSGEDPILPKEGHHAARRTVVIAPMFGRDTCLGFLAGEDGELDEGHIAGSRRTPTSSRPSSSKRSSRSG